MNRVHKTLWSETAQCWQAVPETAKAAGKGSVKSASGGVLATVVMGLALTGGAGAQSPPPPASTQLPTGGSVARGSATITQTATAQAAAMTVNQSSQRAVINWDSFNLGQAASINFVQPNAQAVTLNRVNDHNPSQIFGRISANGQVFLSNPSGVYFSPTSSVDVGALVATSHRISDEHFMAGTYQFERNGSTGKVVNEGRISAGLGGYVALLAPEVQNAGVVLARAGTVALAAGEVISLQVQGGGLAGITTTPSTIQTLIENKLAVQAPDGQIILSAVALNKLQAGVIKHSGSLEANSLVAKGGKIFLEADDITLAATSRIEAKGPTGGGTVLVGGDWQGTGDMRQATKVTMQAGARIDASATDQGDGGKVVLWSDIHQADSVTRVNGSIKAEAGPNGGDGGKIETSGHVLNVDDIQVSTQSAKGQSGEWLLDPYNITITDNPTATSGTAYNPTISSPSFTSGATSSIRASSIQNALALNSVTITTGGSVGDGQGNGDINVASNITWSTSNSLTLSALGQIYGTGNFVRTGTAGLTFTQTGNSTGSGYAGVISGTGSFTKSGAGSLKLSGLNTFTGNISIGSGTLQIGDAGSLNSGNYTGSISNSGTFKYSSSADQTLSGIISSSGALVKDTDSNSTLTLNAANTYTGTTTISAGNLQIGNGSTTGSLVATAITNNANLVLNRSDTSSAISGIISGSGNLIKQGTGTVSLSADNTYTGTTTISAGTLNVGTASTTGTLGTGAITVANGATLAFNRTGTLTVANDISGAGGVQQIANGTTVLTGNNSYSGTTTITSGTLQVGSGATAGTLGTGLVVNSSTLTFNRSDNVTLDKSISGSGTVNVLGSRVVSLGSTSALGNGIANIGANVNSTLTLDLNGYSLTNTQLKLNGAGYNGQGVLINNSATAVALPSTVAVNLVTNSTIGGSGDLSIAGVISGTKLTKVGINTLYLSGNNTYSSGTVINNGILKKGNRYATGDLTSNPLTIDGGTLDINGFEVTQADSSYNHTETFTGSGYNNLGALINSKNDGATPVYWLRLSIGGTGFSLGGAGNLYLKPYSVTNATGKTIGKLGSGTVSLEFTDNTNYSVAYAISAGTLDLRSGGGMSGYNVIAGTSADIAAGANFKITGYVDITRFNTYNTTFAGSITGAGSLIVDGLSQVKLTGANTFSGGTTIVGGTLVAGVASASSGGAITSSPLGTGAVTVASGGSFDFGGYAVNNNITASGTGSNSTGAIQNSSGSVTTSANITLNGGATFNIAGTGLSLSGTVTDGSSAGAITKAGTGALTLGGANTYSGGTTVSAGNVVAGSASTSSGGVLTSGALGTGALNIASGASFDFAGNNVDNNITATGTGISFAGAIRNTTGTVTSNANITLVGGATINVAGTNLTLNGVLADGSTAGAITKTGTGDLVLKGANTYTGSTTISAGVLEVGGTGSLGGGTYAGAISIASTSGGAFKYTSSASETLSGIISGAGALIKDGSSSSTLTLSGNNTFTGATSINNGTLRVASSNALGGTGGATTVASGATIEFGGASNLAIGAEAITLAAGASLHNVSGTNTYSGALTLQGNANIDVDTTTSLNLTRVGSATTIPAGATLSTTLGGNLTFASGVTGGSMARVTLGGSYTGSTGTTVVTSVTGLFVRLCDTVSVGTAACTTSSTYGDTPNYTYGFFTSSTGGSRVALNVSDFSVSNLTWTGTLPTSTSSAGTYALTYASGISNLTNASYRLMGAGAATNWTITPKAVSISLTSPSYTYDGVTSYAAMATAATLSAPGMVGADSVASVTKTITGSGIAQAGNFTITPSLPVLGAGTLAGNYSFTLVPLSGSVAKANLGLTGTKVYDGSSAVTGAQLTATGVNGESFAVSGTGASGNLATANVQSNVTLSSLSGLTLGSSNGSSAAVSSNYNSLSTTGSSFSVTPATAKLTAAKTFDGDDSLTAGQLSITGVTVNGVTQTLAYTGTASLADANVAYANNHVTGVGLTLSNGTGLASNYQLPALAYGSNNSATISPATASVSASKTYDGSTSLSSAQVSLSGVVVNGTLQTLAYTGTAALSDAYVATANKYVNTSQMVLANGTGGNAGTASNYVLPAASYHGVRNTASVSALALTATNIAAATSVYGDAITAGALSFNNKVGTDDVASAVTVTVPGGSYSTTGHAKAGSYFQSASNVLTGTKASNYSFAGLTSLTANYTVSAKPLTISVPGATKVYDASNTIYPTAPASIIGVVTGDDVQLGAGNVTGFVDKNVGVNKAVTYTGFSINGGTDAGNYALSANPASTANITAKPITATGITALNQVYNASTNASLNTANATLTAGATTATDNKIYSADQVTINSSSAAGSFANANVGTAKAVTITGLALSGTDAGNYAVSDASGATANITAKSVTVNGLSVPASRAYDGTTSATVTGNPALLSAQAAGSGTATDGIPYVGDVIGFLGTATASYDSKDVLTASMVQFAGLTSGNANYTLSLGSQAATITPKTLTVSGTSVANKVYDGNTTATLSGGNLVGVEAADVVNVVLAQSASFADKNAGTAKAVNVASSISGTQASNYSLQAITGLGADINKAALTVTANNASKTYGDANPTLSTTVSGFVNGETLATSGVAGAGSATTTATTTTAVGTAVITAGVGSLTASNYDFSRLVDGTLTIQAAPIQPSNNANQLVNPGQVMASLVVPVVIPPSVAPVQPAPVPVLPTPPGPAPVITIAPPAAVVADAPAPSPSAFQALPAQTVATAPVVSAFTPLPSNLESLPVQATPPTPLVVASAQAGASTEADNKDRQSTAAAPPANAASALQGEQVVYLRPAVGSAPTVAPVALATPPTSAVASAPAPVVSTAPAPLAAPAAPAATGVQVATASPEAPPSAASVAGANAPFTTVASSGVLPITILRGNNAQPTSAGVAFEQNADTVSLRATDAPPLPLGSSRLVFNDRLTTFMVANSNGMMVEFQGSLVNNRMVIVAPSNAARLVAQSDMNIVLAAAVTSLGRESRVMLAQLESVVLDLR